MQQLSSPIAPHHHSTRNLPSPVYYHDDILIRTPRTKNNKVVKKSRKFPSPPIVPSQKPSWKQELTQKQKFLQPFGYLYDTMEQARMNKDLLWRIQECVDRIEKLEHKVAQNIPITPSATPPPPSNDMKSIFSQLSSRIGQLESKLIIK
jgi:hypothetical protein